MTGHALLRDRRAATALEFAIISIPMFMMVFFVLNVGLQLFLQNSLDVATDLGGRQIRVGTIRGTSDSALRSAICAQLGGVAVNCATLQIYVTSGASFAALSPAVVSGGNLSKTGFTPGVQGNYVLVQVAYPTPTPFQLAPVVATFLSTTVFINET